MRLRLDVMNHPGSLPHQIKIQGKEPYTDDFLLEEKKNFRKVGLQLDIYRPVPFKLGMMN